MAKKTFSGAVSAVGWVSVYTVPSGKVSQVLYLGVTNSHASAVARVELRMQDGSNNRLLGRPVVGVGGTVVGGGGLVLEAGDVVQVQLAAAGGSVDVVLSVDEV